MKKWENFIINEIVNNPEGFDEVKFDKFINAFKRNLRMHLPEDVELVKVNKGFYEFSGFLEDTARGGYVYFSIPDVRMEPTGWKDNILVRTAKNRKDFKGGPNHFTTLQKIGYVIESII